MLNIKELEKRWLYYKIKSYIPHALIAVVLLIILSTIAIFLTSKKQHINSINKTASLISPKKPAMPFINHIQDETSIPLRKKEKIETDSQKHVKKVIKRDKITTKIAVAKEQYLNLEPKEAPALHKHSIITIERKESKKDIDDVIKRFKNNHNPALSLFVAKKYYELGEYKQAYNYALITNGINNNIEASWLIFVKSLVKLHKKDMAIKTLIKYINYSHSENAKILLDNIKSGKF